jgi:hypothetical protein
MPAHRVGAAFHERSGFVMLNEYRRFDARIVLDDPIGL